MDYIYLLVVFNLFLIFLLYNKKKCNHVGGDNHPGTEEEINKMLTNKRNELRLLNEELGLDETTTERKSQIVTLMQKKEAEIKTLEDNLENSQATNTMDNTNTATPDIYDPTQDHLLNINNVTTYMKNWCNRNYTTIQDSPRDNNVDYEDTRLVCGVLQ
tara:strand:+ start:434 stop:910 length:477 start_codon:yes stop_codon:yes gene_type:complete